MHVRIGVLALTVLGTCIARDAWGAASYPAHRGDSPWSFTTVAEPSSRFVVNDADSTTIDVYLLRAQGPIVIDVRTRRYIGPTDGNGYLLNVAELRSRGIIGDTATITLPAYDVDETTPPNTDCDGDGTVDILKSEVDELFLNDQKIGTLTGSHNRWIENTFSVPMSRLKFPSQPGQTATNRFRVDIDVANRNAMLSGGGVGCQRWAVAIDWIGVEYEVSSPVVLVHGILSSGAALGNFKTGLLQNFISADNSITLTAPAVPNPVPTGCESSPYNDSITANIEQLRTLVPAIAERYGSETLHFVAHSKGGLDLRGFLSTALKTAPPIMVGSMSGQAVTRDLEGRSLVTLDTPHRGSVLAQFGVEGRQLTMAQAVREDIDVAAAKRLEGGYYCDLTPGLATAFMAGTRLPGTVQWALVASDADCNGDLRLTDASHCPGGQSEVDGFPGGALAATRLYRLVGGVSSVTIKVIPTPFGPDLVYVEKEPTTSFQPNDAIVTQESAALIGRYSINGWHHMNVHSTKNADAIASDAQGNGMVEWRTR